MKQIKFPKMREARLRQWHGENWSEEDQKEFERERNRRQCLNHRNKHRDEYTSYQNRYQISWRIQHPNYYKYLQRYRLDKKNGKFDGTFKEWQIKNGVKA